MINSRFPFAVFVAAMLLLQSVYATAQATPTHDDIAAGKKDKPPRPKPTPGPRDGDDN